MSLVFYPVPPYVKDAHVIDESDKPLMRFKLDFLWALLIAAPTVGCTVVQDYGEDYLEWRDLGGDTHSTTEPDVSEDVSASNDVAVPTDTSLPDTIADGNSVQSDAALTDTAVSDATSDDVGPTDTGVDGGGESSVWDKDPLFDVRSYIRLIEFHDTIQGNQWSTTANEIRIRMLENIPPSNLKFIQASGACKLYLLDTNTCEVPCLDTAPTGLNAGLISIAGLSSVPNDTVTLAYGPGGEYTVQGNSMVGANLFDSQDSITVQIEGASGFQKLDIEVQGVSDMKHNNSQVITLSDFEDYNFTWEPSGNDEVVELILKTGPWIASQIPEGVITCAADDSKGAISVPLELIQQFPYFDGTSNDQHPSMVRRINRTVIESPEGPLDVSVISESFLRAVH